MKEVIIATQNSGKAKEFEHVLKMGRTQLQDAVPMTLGQEFEAYAVTLEENIERLNEAAKLFLVENMVRVLTQNRSMRKFALVNFVLSVVKSLFWLRT